MPLDSVVAVDAVGGSTVVDIIINPPVIVDIISGVGPQGPATRPGGTSGQIQYNNNSAFGGFTMSGDATVNTSTGALALSTSGVTAGTYQGLTVDAKGRVTAASNQSYLTGNQPITLSGDTTGTGSTSIATTTVQIQGRPVATTAPNDGQALLWSASNTRWQPGNVVTSGGVTMADTPPASPTQGQGWWNSNNAAGGGQLYLWFNDGTSSQWVPSANLTGFITSLTQGNGITLTPNPISGGGGTIALSTPVTVANGGTGAATAQAALTSLGALPAAGVTNGSNAAAGQVGEFISGTIAQTGIGNGAWGSPGSISLTAGDWDVWGWGSVNAVGGTLSAAYSGVSATNGVAPTYYAQLNTFSTSNIYSFAAQCPTTRFNLTTTTTIYLNCYSAWGTATGCNAGGALFARRMR